MPPAITVILLAIAIYLAIGLWGTRLSKWLYDEYKGKKTEPGIFKEILFILSGPLITALEIFCAVFCVLTVISIIGAFFLGFISYSLIGKFLESSPEKTD